MPKAVQLGSRGASTLAWSPHHSPSTLTAPVGLGVDLVLSAHRLSWRSRAVSQAFRTLRVIFRAGLLQAPQDSAKLLPPSLQERGQRPKRIHNSPVFMQRVERVDRVTRLLSQFSYAHSTSLGPGERQIQAARYSWVSQAWVWRLALWYGR